MSCDIIVGLFAKARRWVVSAGERPRFPEGQRPATPPHRTDRNRHGSLLGPRRPEGLQSSAGQGRVPVAGAPGPSGSRRRWRGVRQACDAYREVLAELERGDDRESGGPVAAPSGRGDAMPTGPGAARESYVAWLRQVSEESARRRHVPWWRKHPARARAWLLGLIGLCGVLVLCAALALGMRSPGRAARRRGTSGIGQWSADERRGSRPEPVARSPLTEQGRQGAAGIDPERPADGIADLGRRVDAEARGGSWRRRRRG